MADLKTKVELSLKDGFSSSIKKSGDAANQFGKTASGAFQRVDKALSGISGTLATIGVAMGTAALVKGSIDYQDAITRIGTNAGISGRAVNEFGRKLTQTAYDAKISRDEMVSFAQVLADSSIGMDTIEKNAAFMADAIQGLSISGTEAGQVFTALYKRGADTDTIKEKLNNLAEISDRLGNVSLSQFTKYLPQLAETSGVSVDNIEELYTAINMLGTGTNKPAQAVNQYMNAMKDFGSPETRNAMRRYLKGFDPVDKTTGELKSFAEIMEALSQFAEERGSNNNFGKAFGLSEGTIKALKQYGSYYKETAQKVEDLGDTSNAITNRADQNAATVTGSLNRLKNAASDFADANLIKPIEWLANMLDRHPKGMEYAVKGLAGAIVTLAGLKALGTVVSLVSNLKGLKGGNIGAGLTGGAAMPVYVTNWGDGTSVIGAGGQFQKQINPQLNGKPTAPTPTQLAGVGAAAGISAAIVKIPQMMNELDAIKKNENLTVKERGKAKGGAIGDASGSIVGATGGAVAGTLLGAIAGGAIAGTAIGTAVPGLGNAVGLLVGAGIGAAGFYFGGKAGRAAGGKIGESLAADDSVSNQVTRRRGKGAGYIPVSDLPPQITQTGSSVTPQKVELGGQAVMDVNVNLSGISPTATVTMRDNTTPFRFNFGSAVQARTVP